MIGDQIYSDVFVDQRESCITNYIIMRVTFSPYMHIYFELNSMEYFTISTNFGNSSASVEYLMIEIAYHDWLAQRSLVATFGKYDWWRHIAARPKLTYMNYNVDVTFTKLPFWKMSNFQANYPFHGVWICGRFWRSSLISVPRFLFRTNSHIKSNGYL